MHFSITSSGPPPLHLADKPGGVGAITEEVEIRIVVTQNYFPRRVENEKKKEREREKSTASSRITCVENKRKRFDRSIASVDRALLEQFRDTRGEGEKGRRGRVIFIYVTLCNATVSGVGSDFNAAEEVGRKRANTNTTCRIVRASCYRGAEEILA